MSVRSGSHPLVFGIKDDFDVSSLKNKGNILVNPSFKQNVSSSSDSYSIVVESIVNKNDSQVIQTNL